MSRIDHISCRALLVVAIGLTLTGLSASSAWAHATFQDSTPEPGARLETAPTTVVLRFSEPISPALSRGTILDAATGRRLTSKLRVIDGQSVVLTPRDRLGVAPYRVEWHVVSTLDGHPRSGAFAFGVRTDPLGNNQQLELSPLADDGWLRAGARGALYATLMFFAGGLFASVLLARAGPAAAWLLPAAPRDHPEWERRVALSWRRVRRAGWLAAACALAVAALEAEAAGGTLRPQVLDAYLVDTGPGRARLATVALLGLAATLAARAPRRAAVVAAGAWLAIAFGGHAGGADPRVAAVVSDFIHVLAGSVWLGGIALIAATWVLPAGRAPLAERLAVMRTVLVRFGRVALPAFAIAVAAGLANAAIELQRPSALWETGYGRVLAVKAALVALIAGASYVHAMRLRPRILATSAALPRAERAHWRLLGAEPPMGLGVLAAAGLLASFPLPPTQLDPAPEPESSTSSHGDDRERAALRNPRRGELAVAENAGPWIVAARLWRDGGSLRGRLRLLDLQVEPVAADVQVLGGRQRACGRGCWDIALAGSPARIDLRVSRGQRVYRTALPARWQAADQARGRRLLRRAQTAMRALRSATIQESLSSGPGVLVRTTFRLEAPDRMHYVLRSDERTESIGIGSEDWTRTNSGPWRHATSPDFPLRTRAFFAWTRYARTVRLMAIEHSHGRRTALIALADPGDAEDNAPPSWFRLRIDLATMRVVRLRMIAPGHFMRQRYLAFNTPRRIAPPVESDTQPGREG